MSLITIPNTFSAGAVIIASQHNSNFSTIASDYNGNIDNTNIAAGAAIAYSKLSLSGSIVNADISGSAAIVDSKLAQITTASKVSGAAITGLASVPSGAGVLPIANIATGTPTGTKFVRDDGTLQVPSNSFSFVSATSWSGFTSGDIAITSTKQYLVKTVVTSMSADSMNLRFNNDTTGNHYGYITRALDWATTATNTNSNNVATQIVIGTADTASSGQNSFYDIWFGPQPGTGYLYVYGKAYGLLNGAVNGAVRDFSGGWVGGSAATSFRLTGTTGTITATTYLYEIKTS